MLLHLMYDSMLNRLTVMTKQQMHTFNISDEVDGSPIFYTITYLESSSGRICDSAEIPASSCENKECRNEFNVSTSSCSMSTRIHFIVSATNILGKSINSNSTYIGNYANNNALLTMKLIITYMLILLLQMELINSQEQFSTIQLKVLPVYFLIIRKLLKKRARPT